MTAFAHLRAGVTLPLRRLAQGRGMAAHSGAWDAASYLVYTR